MNDEQRKIDDIDVFPKMVGDKQAKDKMLAELSEWAKEGVETAERKARERKERDEEDRIQRKFQKQLIAGTAISIAVITIASVGYTCCRGIDYLSENGQKELNSRDCHFYSDENGFYFADTRGDTEFGNNNLLYAKVEPEDYLKCADILREKGYTESQIALILGNTFGWDMNITSGMYASSLDEEENKPSKLEIMKTAIDAGNEVMSYESEAQKENNSGRGSK